MHIKAFEICNFRKLLSVRIDISGKTTLFVGANNSGKSSAMLALRRFLVSRPSAFRSQDITLCHFPMIDQMGVAWEAASDGDRVPDAGPLSVLLPSLDIWVSAVEGELQHVGDLIPSFAWTEGLVGMRYRLEPESMETLYTDFRAARKRVVELCEADEGVPAGGRMLKLWPMSLTDFLNRRLGRYLTVRWYKLDPALLMDPDPQTRMARPQGIATTTLPFAKNPIPRLIRVHEISAQRGFGDGAEDEPEDDGLTTHPGRKLSEQLRSYYHRHLDPGDEPDATDLAALRAIEDAQDMFDARLKSSFGPALQEVQSLNYPGFSDPTIHVATKLGAVDGLAHEASVLFELKAAGLAAGTAPLRLPETANGLGYQNLISMIFRLMSFRDGWLRKAKAEKTEEGKEFEPIHLVLIEEPEAHLHVQVQQVFVRYAYNVLRNDADLGDNPELTTHLLVSSHSSHVAHELPYSCLRYFRRLQAGMLNVSIPVSTVASLEEAFGSSVDTHHFVARYLRAQHADIFFADAVILVEGAAERMVLPHFIRAHFKTLDRCYVTLLDIGGSHAHRLLPLINALGMLTLVITDLDAVFQGAGTAVARGEGQTTSNPTLRRWMSVKNENATIDALLALDDGKKVFEGDTLFSVRIAYQTPVTFTLPKTGAVAEGFPGTFEDALVMANPISFAKCKGKGLARRFAQVLQKSDDAAGVGEACFDALKSGDKAEFALTVLGMEGFSTLTVPDYIHAGLAWLEGKLVDKSEEVVPLPAAANVDEEAGE